MLKRRVLAGFFSGLLILALPVEAEWSGYINEKVPVKYGFMSTPGLNAESGHLRLVCVAGSTFQILPDTRNAKEPYGNTVLVSVDSLPATEFSLTRLGDDYSIDHQEPAFWKLIAQMAAGANILVETARVWHSGIALRVLPWSLKSTVAGLILRFDIRNF